MPTALITGSSGFIGGRLAEAIGTTHEVIALNRTAENSAYQSIPWDMSEPLPQTLPEKVDLILHAAATDGRNLQNPISDCFQINTAATAELLQYAECSGAKQFVYISTGSVYPLLEIPVSEDEAMAPRGPYAASKAAAECLVAGFADKLQTLTLRLFYPYGAGQKLPRLIPGLVDQVQKGELVSLHGQAGNPRVNPVHVTDVTRWTLKLMEQGTTGTFNVAGSETVSIRRLAEQIAELAGLEVQFEVGPELIGNRLGDITRIIAATGYQPQQTLHSGLEEMLKHPVI